MQKPFLNGTWIILIVRVSRRWFKLSEEEQIKKLKEIGLSAEWTHVQKKVIDALEAYGEKGIPAISEIVDKAGWTDVQAYGLEAVKKIKEKRSP